CTSRTCCALRPRSRAVPSPPRSLSRRRIKFIERPHLDRGYTSQARKFGASWGGCYKSSSAPRRNENEMSRFFDRLLFLLKWPVALASLLLLPALGLSLWDTLRAIAAAPRPLYPFFAGAGVYLAAWWLLLRRPSLG